MKLFIWDFHGTLEIGNEMVVLEITNKVLGDFGYSKRLTGQECLDFYGLKWFEYFESTLSDEPHERHMELQETCFDYSNSHPELIRKYVKPANNAIDVLEKIKLRHDQILVSNTKPESLILYLDTVKMNRFFPPGKFFATNSHVKYKAKLDIVRNYLLGKSFDQIITVGDSPKDVEFGTQIGATTFLYTHRGLKFKQCEPDFRINDLNEIFDFVAI
jgi:phosphoglycolate phosphatase-like HAD superfamily hydrolase